MGDQLSDAESPETDTNFSRIFLELEPLYLSFGMSRDEYWNGDPKIASAYRKADDIRRHRENAAAWRQGQYFLSALNTALSALFAKNSSQIPPYVEEPLPLTEKEAEEQEQRRQQKLQEEMVQRFVNLQMN